ncbi:MAG: hypothetical protein FJW38_10725 [Acidobacteria bacterium]|nr:hypothetical protein [Acidobacteriota bacterium]
MSTAFRFLRSLSLSALLAAETPLAFELLEKARDLDVLAHDVAAIETVIVNGGKPERHEVLWQHGEKLRKSAGGAWQRLSEVREKTPASFRFGKFEGLDGGFKLSPSKREGALIRIDAKGHDNAWRHQERTYWIDPASGALRRYECRIVADDSAARKGSFFRYEYGAEGLKGYDARFSLGREWTMVRGTLSDYKKFAVDSRVLPQ